MPKMEVSEATVRGVLDNTVNATNAVLAQVYKVGTSKDLMLPAQVRTHIGGRLGFAIYAILNPKLPS